MPHSVIDGRLFALHVGDAQPSSDRQLGKPDLADPRGHHLHRVVEEVGDEHLAADVHVDPDQLDRRRVLRPGHRAGGVAGGHAEAELRVDLSGADEVVGVRLDAGRGPDEDLRPEPVVGMELREPVELVEAVDHDATHPGGPRLPQLLDRLVVAVEHEALGRNASGQGHVQLAAGGHIEVHPLLVRQARHGQAQEGLGGVGHAVAEGGDRLPAPTPEVGLVVDEQGRAVLLGQVEHVASTDAKPSVVADRRRVRQQAARERPGHALGYIASGADTPSRSSPIAMPVRAPSTSHSRACVSSGGTSPST